MKTTPLLKRIGDLPTLPLIASRITQEMNKDALTARLLGEIIAEDTALAAKVLRLANSAFYGLPKKVTSLKKAVMVLGFNNVKNLALSISIHELFGRRSSSVNVTGLWLHSLGCAVAAKTLLEHGFQKGGDDAFLHGILHDIGKIVIIHASPSAADEIVRLIREEQMAQEDAESRVIEVTHQKLGAELLTSWKFPDPIVDAIALHHKADPCRSLQGEALLLAQALFAGNQIAKALSLGESTNPLRQEIPSGCWNALQVKRDELKTVATRISNSYALLLKAWEMG